MAADSDQKKISPVLLAEDNQVNKRMMTLLLRHFDIDPVIASDGIEAVEKALESNFSLIIMDMHMPRMDGLEATRKIKETLGENAPAIVALTADVIKSSMDQAIIAGVDAYLSKPISKEKLKHYLDLYCFKK